MKFRKRPATGGRAARGGTNHIESPISSWNGYEAALLAFVILLGFMGGASRAEEWKTLAVKIVAALVVTIVGIAQLRGAGRHDGSCASPSSRAPAAYLLSALGLVALYLVPLPPSLWMSVPGREAIGEFFDAVGLANAWRPLTVSTALTLNSFTALLVPLALVLLAARSRESFRTRLIDVFLIFALASVGIGVLQVVSGSKSLYFYDLANFGRASGVFANRNHHAIFLAASIPLCTYRFMENGSARNGRNTLYLIAGGVILAGCLLGSSRAGLGLAGIATLASLCIFLGSHRASTDRGGKFLTGSTAVVGFTLLALPLLAYNSDAFGRLIASDPIDDLRFKLLPDLVALAGTNFPFGSGPGTFEDVYRMAEADENLMHQYVNEAHNDWLQPFIEFGIFALPLFAWPLINITRAAHKGWVGADKQSRVRTQCLLISLSVLALGSFVDYPMRTPLLLTFGIFLWHQLLAVAMDAGSGRDHR